MNQIYIIFYVSSVVISSLITVIFIERNAIARKLSNWKNQRKIKREKRIKKIVYEYLMELKNEQIDDIT